MRSRARRARRSGLLIAVLTPTAGACVDAASEAPAAFAVDTLPTGRVHVTNTTTGAWAPGSEWTLVEDLRLGCVEGCGPEQFSQVSYILTDAEDRIHILDYPSQEIRIFSPDGSHLRTLGGQGEGPGELTYSAGLDWAPDGRLWVWGSQRYTVLEPDGEEVARYMRPVRGVVYPWMGGFTPDGRYIDFGVDGEIAGFEDYGDFRIPRMTGSMTVPVVAFTPPARFDSLPPLAFQEETTDEGQRLRGGRSLVGIQDAEGDMWLALTDDYTVYRRTIEGDTVLSFSLPARPAPVPVEEMDAVIQDAAERNIPGPRLERSSFAAERWMVTNVLIDDAGHVYVFPEEDGVPRGSVVDVFLESGVYQGRMSFGVPVLTEGPPPHVTDRHVYAVVENELAVPFVVRYRIEKPAG